MDCECCNFAELVISSTVFFFFIVAESFEFSTYKTITIFAEIILPLSLQFGWLFWGFPGSSVGKESTCNAGDPS